MKPLKQKIKGLFIDYDGSPTLALVFLIFIIALTLILWVVVNAITIDYNDAVKFYTNMSCDDLHKIILDSDSEDLSAVKHAFIDKRC